MKHHRKTLAWFVGICLTALVGVGFFGCEPERIPPSFQPRVSSGQDFLQKAPAFKMPELGGITDIVLWRSKPGDKESVIVAGTAGAVVLEQGTLKVVKKVQLNDGKPPFSTMHIIDADGDGNVEFFREPHAAAPACLYDDRGHVLWSCSSPGSGFPEVAYGDLDGNGKVSFLFWSSSDEIELRDHKGEVQWSQRWDRGIRELQMLDTDHDGKAELVYIDGKAVCIRDRQGTLLRRETIKEASYVNALHPIHYPDRNGRGCLCVGFNIQKLFGDPRQIYRILELDGKTVVKDLEPSALKTYLPGRTVNLQGPGEVFRVQIERLAHQAQIAGFSATRLELSVYGATDELKYQEILASSEGDLAKGDGALAVVPPTSSNDKERLLVGYGPDLWEYTLKDSKR